MEDIDLFERFLMEAPEDEAPPDMNDSPPDMPADDAGIDLGGDDDPPPDMGGEDEGDFGTDEFNDDTTDDQAEDDQATQDLGLDTKVSAIMNATLYNRFLRLLTNLSEQISSIKNNSDMIYVISPEASAMSKEFKNLEDSVKTYLKNMFSNENYSKNLLFFNKSINLLKLLNDSFNDRIQKGIKDTK